ncbi:unnamed protein product, partial [marine sediment metagenome]
MAQIARMLDEGHYCRAAVAAIKARLADATVKITQEAIQVVGGIGYSEDYPLERYYRDAKVGQTTGNTEEQSIAIVKHALESGINFIDTAEVYRTENIVGEAIKGFDRNSLVISTKKSTWGTLKPKDVIKSFERSLNNLGTDYVDIYHLHGVILEDYDYLYSEIVPTLLELRDRGKIHHVGITERFNPDPNHAML